MCGAAVQDLEYLCEGLEGRSSNPVAVLFDSLLLPNSDFGLDHLSPLEWRYRPEHAIPHLVLGTGPPGGAWHVRTPTTLSSRQPARGRRCAGCDRDFCALRLNWSGFISFLSGDGGLHANSESG